MKNIKSYLITFGMGLVFVLLLILSKKIFGVEETKTVYKILTDSFFVVGILIFGFGLLVVASNGGTFDMLNYGVQKFFDLFRRDMTKVKHQTFYDYRVAKEGNKPGFLYLVAVGLILIIISLIFLALYYQY